MTARKIKATPPVFASTPANDAAPAGKNRTPAVLCEEWLAAKKAETKANETRVAIEAEIVAVIGAKPEGSATTNLEDFKVTTTGKLTRTLDDAVWESIASQIPADLRPVTLVQSYKIDDKGCRWLAENRPELWAIVSKAITTKPAKTAVKVERL